VVGNNFANSQTWFVRRFDGSTGVLLGTFATGGASSSAHDIVFGPDGNLYLADFGQRKVSRFNGTTGEFIDDFVTSGSGGLSGIEGLVFGPDGNLYVTSRDTSQVLRYDGSTGAFLDVFATVSVGGGVDLAFGPDGNLYVLTLGVPRFDGATGEFIDQFASGFGDLSDGSKLVFGPDGNLYISTGHISSAVRSFEGSTGESGTFVGSVSGGLAYATGLLFAPQLCDHLGDYGACADGAGIRCRAEGVTGVGRSLSDVSRIDVLDCGPSDGPGDFEITPVCPSGYSYCVENADDGVGNHVKLGVVERSLVNELVNLSQLLTSFDPTPVFPSGPAGTFSITATFTNTTAAPIGNPVFRVTELTRNNLVLNSDAGAIGVGAALTPDVGADGMLSPGESFTAQFVIGLQIKGSFQFLVDLLGVPEQ